MGVHEDFKSPSNAGIPSAVGFSTASQLNTALRSRWEETGYHPKRRCQACLACQSRNLQATRELAHFPGHHLLGLDNALIHSGEDEILDHFHIATF